MEKIKRSGAWCGLLALVTALCLLMGGAGTALAEPTQEDPVPARIEVYCPGGFLPGANGKATILGSVSAAWPDGTHTVLSGATVSLYPHPTSKEDRLSGAATPVAQTTTDKNGIYQFSMDASPSGDTDFDIMVEYKGLKELHGNAKDDSSGTYIKRRIVVRPILTTEANYDEAGNIKGKLAEPKVLELKRDQLVDWDTYLLGRGTNLWGEKAPGFDVMPIEWWKNNAEAYGKLSSAFATHGTKITAVDENGSPVDLSQITAKPGTYTVTYEIGFELPRSSSDPITAYLSNPPAGKFPGYPEWPAEGNRMVLSTASLTAKVPYKLSYDANGGEGATPDEASFMKGASVTVANQGDLKKGDAEFIGWNTQADGNGTSYAAGQKVTLDADTTLYAQWKDTNVVITYDPNGGAWGNDANKKEVVVTKGTEIEIIEAPTREGHTFLYWKGSEFQPGDKYTANADHTFTAVWKENKSDSNEAAGTSHSSTTGDKPSSSVQKTPASKLPPTGDNASYLAIASALVAGAGLAAASALMLRRRKQQL